MVEVKMEAIIKDRENLKKLRPWLRLRSPDTRTQLPRKDLARERSVESSSHQGGIHRGDDADQDVGEGDQDVEGGLHVPEELLGGVAGSAGEPAEVRVPGSDGDQLPVVVHADAAGQGLQPSDEIPSLIRKISAGRLPASQVEHSTNNGSTYLPARLSPLRVKVPLDDPLNPGLNCRNKFGT